MFWLPVCQCTRNIFPSFKVILFCDLSYMGCFCAFFSVDVGSGRIFAIRSFPFLLPLPCHYVEGGTSALTGTTSQGWPSCCRYTKRADHLWQPNVRSGARRKNLREERRNLRSWQMFPAKRSQNHRTVCVGRALKDYLVLTPLPQARNLPLRWTWQQRGKLPSQKRNLSVNPVSSLTEVRKTCSWRGWQSYKYKAKRETVKSQ